MNQTLPRILLLLAGFVLLAFVVILVNQTAQVVALAATLHPNLGTATLWGLLLLYAVLLLTPVVLFFRLPPRLDPPESEESPEFAAYFASLQQRLQSNPHLLGVPISDREQVRAALSMLDEKANKIACQAASTVFLSTAISQNGRLDVLLVLSAQSRMVWRIAHLYYQRPTAREMLRLYSNVAATAFVAGELDDLDVSEQMEPVVGSALGSLSGAVPGLQGISTIFVNSVLSGSANALLTLRVGMVAKRYCNALVTVDRRLVRRSAMAEATRLLGSIVATGAARLSRGFWQVSKNRVGDTISVVGQSVRGAGSAVMQKFRSSEAPGSAAAVEETATAGTPRLEGVTPRSLSEPAVTPESATLRETNWRLFRRDKDES